MPTAATTSVTRRGTLRKTETRMSRWGLTIPLTGLPLAVHREIVSGLSGLGYTDAWSAEVLMVAYMNPAALAKTIESGEAWFYSRSRKKLWKKGEMSGHVQRVIELRVDCDQDALWLKVEQKGPGACHTGRRSCFYRAVPVGQTGAVTLAFRDAEQTFDPGKVYR